MKKITFLLVLLLMGFYGNAQTSLSAGDIAFIGSNVDNGGPFNDNVTFVLLTDIDAATQIIFTDRGWSDTAGFDNAAGDGELTWTSGVARTAGDIITLNLSVGALNNGGAYSNIGDQLFALQGSIASPTFIAGLHFNVRPGGQTNDANWDQGVTGEALVNALSALPNALITGDTAVRLTSNTGTEQDNFRFNCIALGSPITGTPAQIRAILHDDANWSFNNTAGFNPVVEAGCTITVMAASDTTPPVITCASTPGPITAGINGMAAIPDLVSGSSATDDISLPANITITQSPTAGTMQGVGVHVVTVTATDEAGNTASCNINVTIVEPPSTVLAAGDIAFLGINHDGNDGFAFVILRDIIAGTNIKFTDCGVNNPNTINCLAGDGSNTWYSPTAMTAGSVVTLQGSTFLFSPLASSGDQLLAYQGTQASPIFLAAIHSNIEGGTTNDSDWDGAALNNDESALPNQLINGVNAIRVHDSETEIDNWQFDCSLVPGGAPLTGTPANIAAQINNLAYWVNRNDPEYVPTVNANCSFSVVISSDTTPPVISDCGPTPPDITADVLGNATVPDLTGSVVATDDVTVVGNLTISQSPAAGTTITAGVTAVTLFVSDEAGNTATCMINVTVVNIVATTLAAGDIAFVGVNHDGPDDFAFILLRPVLAGTMITFTDCGVNNPNTIACIGVSDSTNTWFAPTDLPGGTVVTLSGSFLTSLGNIGDQIFAYQGSAASPTFIAGVHTSVIGGTNDADWDGSNIDGATSALPDQLTNGVNAIRLHNANAEADNWQFDCTLVPGGLPISGTPAQVAAIINDLQYWVFNDTTPYNPVALATCTYNLDTVPPVAVCQDITVQLDAAGNATITGADVDGGSTDNVGIASLSVTPDTFDCTDIGTPVTVTLTVADAAGNTDTCTATVTVEDNIAPTALCQDITVQLNAVGSASIAAADVDNGSNDACGIASLSVAPNTFDCTDVGANTVTLTVTDNNGNTSTCTATVTVEDNVAPTAVCQDITVQLDAAGNASVTAGDVDGGSTDNCGVASLAVSPSTFDCTNVGANTVTLTVTDVNGNTSTCTANVTVEDNIAPTAICQDITVQLDAAGNATIAGTDVDNGSNDACGIASLSVSPNTFDCTDVGNNTVTLTVTDNNGNTLTCTSTVTIEDNVAPTAICQNVTVQLDAAGSASITAGDVDNGSNDACGVASIAVSQTSFDCTDLGDNTVTLTVTDVNGNTATCTATVTVEDLIPPVITCPADITVNNDAGVCGATVSFTPTVTDNCAGATITSVPPSGSVFPVGTTVVTATATDTAGNTSTCTFNVTVNDTEAPVITCAADVTVSTDSGVCNANVTVPPPTATDNCIPLTVASPLQPFNFASATGGSLLATVTTIVGLTASDADVTVDIQTDGDFDFTSECFRLEGPDGVLIFDECGLGGQCSTQTRNFTVTQATWNGWITTFGNNLDFTLRANNNVNNGLGGCLNNFQLTANVSSSVALTNSFNGTADASGTYPIGTTVVTWTATDAAGNTSTCTQNVTVNDTEPPIALCQDITVQLDAAGNASITAGDVDGGSTDNCGIASLAVSPATFDCSNVGANTVTLTVTDTSGNVSTCTANVTVEDNIAPTAVCQDITVQLDAAGNATITAGDVDGGSTDNCGIASLSVTPNTFDCTNVGANTVTLTVTDTGGNTSTCTANVTVEDNVPPTAVCQDITVQLDAAGNATIAAGDVDGGSTDNCGVASLSVTPSSFNCTNVGANTVTLTVTDVNGNTSTCTANVTVEDNIAPTAICQNVTVQLDAAGSASITAGDVDNGSNDNCGVASIAVSQTSFDCTDLGDNTVTLTVTDVNGNTATCTATVTVEDLIPPVITCPADITVNNDPGVCGATVSFTPTVTDNCAGATITSVPPSGSVFPVGTTVVTVTGTDTSGNTSTCTFNVTVNDTEAPVITCAADVIVSNDPGVCNANVTVPPPTATDNCIPLTVASPLQPFNFTPGSSGSLLATVTTIVGLTASDADVTVDIQTDGDFDFTSECFRLEGPDGVLIFDECGLGGQCSTQTRNFTVTQATWNGWITTFGNNLDFTLRANNNVNNGLGGCLNNFQLTANVSSSVTLTNNITGTADASGNYPVGTTLVTWTATDASGNTSTCTQNVTVNDTEPPVAVCQDITVQLDAAGNASITAGDVDGGSTDNCGIASLAVSPATFDCSNVGANTVTLTVTDTSGNASTCTATVTVEDNVAPTAVCQDITVQLDAAGNATIVAGDVDGGSSDACGIASLAIDNDTFDCSNLGANTVTLTVTDNNGNTSTCTSTVTVEDSIPPVIACPMDVTANTDPGSCFAVVVFPDAIALDNCSVTVAQTGGLPSGSPFPVGVNTVEFTATDAGGNTAVCSFTITVTDNEPPVAVCQDITIQLDANGDASIVAGDVDGGSTDNCGVDTLAIDMDTFDCSNVGDNNVTLTVTDVNGNTSTCVAVVTVEDNVAPVAVCMDITVQLDAAGTVTITGADVDGGSTDACGIDTLDLDIDTFDCSNVGDNTVTLTVTDDNGNTSSCTAIVTVEDNVAPVMVCMDITVELDENGFAAIVPADVIDTIDDACGIDTTAVDIFEFSCDDIGTPVDVVVFSVDVNGNTATCTATVTVIDALPPVITCPADQTVDPGTGNLNYEVPDYFATGEATAVDNCTDPVTITTQTPAPGTLLPDGVYTITLTAEDEYGNVATCDFELTVESILGVDDNDANIGTLVLYPNPATDVVYLSNPQAISLNEMAIYDLTGRLIRTINLTDMGTEKAIDIHDLATATYAIVITGEQGQITKQLIKE